MSLQVPERKASFRSSDTEGLPQELPQLHR